MKRHNILTGTCALLLTCLGVTTSIAAPWTFGVISDTQWADCKDDGKSPLTCPASIIKQVNAEFIRRKVNVVISVGDTVDTSTVQSFRVRSLYAQDLYNAGIGFYALRGNHDTSPAPVEFLNIFPQISNGGQNNLNPVTIATLISNFTSDSAATANSTNATQATLSTELLTTNPPAAPSSLTPFVSGSNFSFATTNCTAAGGVNATAYNFNTTTGTNYNGTFAGTNGGVSYSFDYNNARFVMLDQFSTGGPASNVPAQLGWISGRLSDTSRPLQAFVFSHKNLLGGNHKDNLFGNAINSADPGDGYGISGLTGSNLTALNLKQAAMDNFIGTLYDNNVGYLITGHDHHHKSSIIKSPLNPAKSVRQIISQSDSSKFYTPTAITSGNETVNAEELYQIGYYIYTVDGPRVTVDHYGVPANVAGTFNGDYFPATPTITGNWVKRLSFGYSLNGAEFQVAQGASYTSVQDNTDKAVNNSASYNETGYVGTSLAILGGTNKSALHTSEVVSASPLTFGPGRAFTKNVATGWTPMISGTTVSDIVSLWGLADLAATQTDTIAVAVTFNTADGASMLPENYVLAAATRRAERGSTPSISISPAEPSSLSTAPGPAAIRSAITASSTMAMVPPPPGPWSTVMPATSP